MAHWVIPLYIISGIVMAIGAYFTIRYRPYCTLKSPEREIAMELHRKKLMNEPMDSEEITKNELYKKNTRLFNYGFSFAVIAAFIHILLLLHTHKELYDMFVLKIIGIGIILGSHGFLVGNFSQAPYCLKIFGLGGYKKEDYIKYIFNKKHIKPKWYNDSVFWFHIQDFYLKLSIAMILIIDFLLSIK